MIADALARADRYRGLGARFDTAFDYLARTDFAKIADGRYAVDGERVFALVQRYRTKPDADGRWESHRRHIDVQLVVRGVERMGVVSLDRFAPEPYDEARDVMFHTGAGDAVTVAAGHFTIFWPEDVHSPGLAAGEPADVLKVVVKIAV
jgi:YhcH/YjgK/YiaL family protein